MFILVQVKDESAVSEDEDDLENGEDVNAIKEVSLDSGLFEELKKLGKAIEGILQVPVLGAIIIGEDEDGFETVLDFTGQVKDVGEVLHFKEKVEMFVNL